MYIYIYIYRSLFKTTHFLHKSHVATQAGLKRLKRRFNRATLNSGLVPKPRLGSKCSRTLEKNTHLCFERTKVPADTRSFNIFNHWIYTLRSILYVYLQRYIKGLTSKKHLWKTFLYKSASYHVIYMYIWKLDGFEDFSLLERNREPFSIGLMNHHRWRGSFFVCFPWFSSTPRVSGWWTNSTSTISSGLGTFCRVSFLKNAGKNMEPSQSLFHKLFFDKQNSVDYKPS